MKEFSMKQLYDVCVYADYPIIIGDRTIEKGENLLYFDKIQLAHLEENRDGYIARGGYDNRPLMMWDETTQIDLSFSQGVFSKEQLALLINSKIMNLDTKSEPIIFSKREKLESNENGIISFNHNIFNVFVYDENFNKLSYEMPDSKTIKIEEPFKDIIIDYKYNYNSSIQNLIVGRELYQGYLILEGKMRTVDDISGKVKTGIIKIPKLKIISDLNLNFGDEIAPNMINFSAIGFPFGKKGDKKVMDIYFLEEDIDSDIL